MERYVLYYDSDQSLVEKAYNYLSEQGITSLESSYNTEDRVYELSTLQNEFDLSKTILLEFLNHQLTEETDTEINASANEDDISELLQNNTGEHAYVDKNVQYEDVSSSGITLIAFGVVGILFVILELSGLTHILSISGSMRWFFYLTMGIMFVIFLFLGIKSMKSASQLKAEAKTEAALISDIQQWAGDTLSAAVIDEHLDTDMAETDCYFSRLAAIQAKLEVQYPNLDTAFKEEMCERIYDLFYED